MTCSTCGDTNGVEVHQCPLLIPMSDSYCSDCSPKGAISYSEFQYFLNPTGPFKDLPGGPSRKILEDTVEACKGKNHVFMGFDQEKNKIYIPMYELLNNEKNDTETF